MGRRAYFSNTPEFYQNFHKMVSSYCMPHEGEPAISLEMMENYMERDDSEAERFMRMLRMISGGLEAQECGIAVYEEQVQELN